ncbi:hypothetical protein CRG98_009335 [Punica granatum]|uniref:Uncharacterized protein n=1 Tax=Punica granatum TaxID=22663 RepID=A0A2I0KP46_PUNGR|nr:hypothetical protein CRG98_009335 [Punica granatum]
MKKTKERTPRARMGRLGLTRGSHGRREETGSRRCSRRSKLDFLDCFLSCLGAPEITVISVCRDWISKNLKIVPETSKALLERSR